jgi:hypothetical protein
LITEWFPRATVTPRAIEGAVLERGANLSGTIEWNRVHVSPDGAADFPIEDGSSHYYAARHTEAAPIASGSEHEKFLFYRGVGRFAPPIVATVASNGAVVARGRGSDALPDVVLFNSHDGAIAYQAQHGISGKAVFDALVPGDESPIKGELEQMLVANGLYPPEAAAMLETWGDSWFQEGTRLFYIVPRAAIDAILPLEISPAPASVARVFVGRIELVTDETMRTVKAALAAGDRAVLAKYGRFLDAIGQRILAHTPPDERAQLAAALQRWAAPWAVPQTGCRTGNVTSINTRP